MRMTIALTSEKKQNINGKVEELTKNSTIREASSLVRGIVASFEAVPNRRLNYRHTEFDNISALQQNKGNFDDKCYLHSTAIAELKLRKENILQVYRELKSLPDVDNTVHSDANIKGWRAHRTCSSKKASF